MLSYGAGNVHSRLRRAKSSSSTRTTSYTSAEPTIDPAIARQHAVTAASLALERASERAIAIRDFQEHGPWQTLTPTPSAKNEHRLGRRQSIRFAGPMAVSTRDRPITRRVAEDPIANHDSCADPLCAPQGLHDQDTRHSEGFTRALPAMEGDYPGTRVSSLPTSYRKLRKAKSMFNPRSHGAIIFTNGTPKKKAPQLNRRNLRSPAPRLHRSFSFLRGDSDNMALEAGEFAIQDTAVQIARDRYLHQVEHQKLKGPTSFTARGKHRKPQKAFRKTVRTSSINSDNATAALSVPQSGVAILPAIPLFGETISKKRMGRKARSFSLSLKNKLKRVFHRPSDADGALPMQQVHATRPYFGEIGHMSISSGVDQQYHHIPSPDRETIQKASSRESLFLDATAFVEKSSRAGSIRSVRSDEDISNSKSRVTSWTNSTAANTITSNQMMEKKRLSIIQEHGGPHQPSSPMRDYGDLDNFFRPSLRENSITRTGSEINSQRIYSALQRRLNENKSLALSEENNSETENVANTITVPSLCAERVALSSRIAPDTSPDIPSRRHGMRFSKSLIFRPSTTSATGNGFNPENESIMSQIDQRKLFDLQNVLTPQQIAVFNESGHSLPKRPLREVKSTFFPSTTRIERSSTSPYRRAMNTSSEDGNGTDRVIAGIDYPKSDNSPLRRITPNSTRGRSTIGTESVYSRTSSGNTPKQGNSSVSLAMPAGSGEPGSAVIITTRASRYELSQSPFNQRRTSSVKSSGTWQKWMASQVAHLEHHGDENKRVFDANRTKENSHKREGAQIDGDDVQIGRLNRFNESLKQPLGIIQGNALSRPVLKNRISRRMVDRFPLLDIDQSSQPHIAEQEPNTPKAHSLTPSTAGSHADPEKYSGRKNNASRGLHPNPSSLSLESRTSSCAPRQGQLMESDKLKMQTSNGRLASWLHDSTPVKHMEQTQRLYSTERIARLRRKQSSGLASEDTTRPEREATNYHLLQENQMIHSAPSPGIPRAKHKEADDLAASLTDSDHLGSPASRKMVDIFLSNRRRHMRISEENGTDPAFL